jgi:lactoylglutathione lyase
MFGTVDYIMVNVSDMGRSIAFYRGTIDLPIKLASDAWSEFETGATTLALHAAPPRGGGETTSQAGPRAGTCSIGFTVSRLDKTYADLVSRGAHFVMPPSDQANEGIRLAVCIDPDGLAMSFVEPIAHTRSDDD